MPEPSDSNLKRLQQKHPTFKNLQDNYRDWLDSYEGTGGFRDGTNLLKFHNREDNEDYNERKKQVYYPNYVRRIVGGLINPMFKSPIKREVKDGPRGVAKTRNKRLKDFEHNCVRPTEKRPFRQVLWNKWLRKFGCRDGDVFGHANIFTWRVQKDESRDLNLPFKSYVFLISPLSLINWETHNDAFSRIVWKEIHGDASTPQEDTGGTQIIKTNTSGPFFYWEVTKKFIRKFDEKGKQTQPSIPNPIGEISLVRLIFEESEVFPGVGISSVGDLYGLQNRVFNLNSEMTTLEREQSFSQFVMEGDADIDGIAEFDDDLDATGRRLIETGARVGLMIPPGTQIPPYYASPDPSQLMVLQERLENIKKEMFHMKSLDGGIATQVKQVVGAVSKELDLEETNLVLMDRMDSLLEADNQVQHYRSLLEEDEEGWTGSSTHDRQFSSRDLQQDLVEFVMLREADVPQTILRHHFLTVMSRHFRDLPEKEKEKWEGEVNSHIFTVEPEKALPEPKEGETD